MGVQSASTLPTVVAVYEHKRTLTDDLEETSIDPAVRLGFVVHFLSKENSSQTEEVELIRSIRSIIL